MIPFHNKEHQYSVTGYDITTYYLSLYVFYVAHNTHETGVDDDDDDDVVLCMYLVVSEFDILPKVSPRKV